MASREAKGVEVGTATNPGESMTSEVLEGGNGCVPERKEVSGELYAGVTRRVLEFSLDYSICMLI